MDLHVTIHPHDGPLRAQLEQQLRDGVRTGRLRAGTRLPATRTLAEELGVSRGVVVEAYGQLAAEGFLVARRGAGTVVARTSPGAATPRRPATEPQPSRVRFDLRTSRPDLSAFPRSTWQAATAAVLRTMPDSDFDYGDRRGAVELRAALAEYLGRARGCVADADHLVAVSGTSQGLVVLWQALRQRGVRRVAVEDPGWRGQRRTVLAAGLEPVPVPVDEDGLVVDALEHADVQAVVVTPAHQFPTGVVLAPERRAALVAWARRTGGVIVEDDYDAEYRYDRDPVGALQGLAPDLVVYAGTASKTLAPALRLGWLLVPPHLAPAVAQAKDDADHGSPTLEQLVLADLLRRGDLDRHLRRTRRRYRARRDAVVTAIAKHLPAVVVGGAAAGLHVVVWLPEGTDEAGAAERARARGIAIDALHTDCTTVAPRGPALLLGYAALPEPTLDRAITELAAALKVSDTLS
jgi:GntR family transcriptional regulator/MocR family aminotransferase